MRLIEKECPNCGAGLHFGKDDTTCKCEYCKREFEIERDTEKKKLDDQFILNELKTPFKFFAYFTFGSVISQIIVISITFVIIIIVAFNLIQGLNDSNSLFNRNASYVTSTSDLSTSDYSTLDIQSRILISRETTGITGMYNTKGNFKREKIYVVSNDKTNYIIPIYKAEYANMSNSEDKHIIYIPIIYKNVKTKNNSIAFSLGEGKISAPEYHFNDNNYSYGYTDLDTLYNEIIKQYENDYKIVTK